MRARKIASALSALALAAVGLAAVPLVASAQESGGVCEGAPPVYGHEWQGQSRDLVPEVAEVSHQVYSYKQKVEKFKTKNEYKKQTQTTVKHGKKGEAKVVSAWSWWSPASTKWSFSDVEVLESGNHAEWTEWHIDGFLGLDSHTDYFDRDYRYVKTGNTQQIPDGHEWQYSGEVTEPRDAPWQLLPGYPKKVVTVEHVPAYYTVWADDGDVVRTDEKVAPEADTDTFRWVYVGEYLKTEAVPPSWQDTDPQGECYNGPPPADAPFLSNHSCQAVGSMTVPDIEGVAYMITTDQAGGAQARFWPGTRYATADFTDPTSEPLYDITATITALWIEDPTRVLGQWSITFTAPEGCDAPEVPEPTVEIEWDEWVEGEYSCTDTQVFLNRWGVKTTTTYKVVGEPGAWEIVVDEVTTEEVSERTARDLTEEELSALDEECSPTEPPVDPPTDPPTDEPTPTDPPTDEPKDPETEDPEPKDPPKRKTPKGDEPPSLPRTGSSVLGAGLVTALLAGLGAGASLLSRRLRNNA